MTGPFPVSLHYGPARNLARKLAGKVLSRPMRRKLTRLLPWLITAAILAYLFTRLPVEQVIQAARNAAPWTIPTLAGIVLLVYLADCLAIWTTFGWFVAPLTFRETLTLRGATYLLALINYALGQGAFVYFLHRTRGVPVVRAAAAVRAHHGHQPAAAAVPLDAGAGARAPQALPEVNSLIWIAYVGLAVYISLLVWRPRGCSARPILDVLLNAGLGGHVRALVVRIPHVAILLVLNHVALHAFGVRVPVLQTLALFPGGAPGRRAAHLRPGRGPDPGGHDLLLCPLRAGRCQPA